MSLTDLAEVQLPKNERFGNGLTKPLTLDSLSVKPSSSTIEEKINQIYRTIDNPVDRTLAIMRLPSGK